MSESTAEASGDSSSAVPSTSASTSTTAAPVHAGAHGPDSGEEQRQETLEEEPEAVSVINLDDDDGEEFHDIRIDDAASSSAASTAEPALSSVVAAKASATTTPTLPSEEQRLSPKSLATPLPEVSSSSSASAGAAAETPTPKHASLLPQNHASALASEVTPRTSVISPLGAAGPSSSAAAAAAAAATAADSTVTLKEAPQLSVDATTAAAGAAGAAAAAAAQSQGSASTHSESSATSRRGFWGLLRGAAQAQAGTSAATDHATSALTQTSTSETSSSSSSFPRLSLGGNSAVPAMAISSAPTPITTTATAGAGRDSFASSNSGRNSRSSLAPSFFAQPTSPSSPSFGATGSNTHMMTPEPPSRKPSAFSPFASIMSNLRTRTSNATSSSSNANDDDLDGRTRLPRRDLDEDKVAEEVMRFADARHVLRTEDDAQELRQLGLRLEEAWRNKLAEVGTLRTKLESAQDTVADLEDENGNLRVQLGLLSEQIAARETDLEDFQKLTIGQIEAQRSLWEEEAREERENLQFSLAQSKRETLEQKSINAQLRLVILGTLQGRLDGLTDWLAKQNDGDTNRRSKRMSALIGKRRESLMSKIEKMDTLAFRVGEGLDADVDATNTSTPLMRQQNFDTPDLTSDMEANQSGGMASSAMDEVSSTTSGKAPGGSWSPKRNSGGAEGDQKEERDAGDGEDEENDNLFDIEDVLFNLPTSPSVPGRRTTMLFNEPLNLDQLRKMGFFNEPKGVGAGAAENDADLALGSSVGADDLLLSPSTSFNRTAGAASEAFLSPAALSLGTSPGASVDSNLTTRSSSVLSQTQQQQNQRLLVIVEKLQADHALAEAARVENVLLQKRLDEESRRAGELEEELVQTKIRLEQTEAAVHDLFGEGEGEEGEGEHEVEDEANAGLDAADDHGKDTSGTAGQRGLGLVTGAGRSREATVTVA
ncbi:hypothetical protein OC834_001728 [Tilletia horrida]|nr:hypothetical protein OC834_001728 [Tilletia horrida]